MNHKCLSVTLASHSLIFYHFVTRTGKCRFTM